MGKHVVLAGCVPQGAPKSYFIQGYSIIGVQQIDRVVEGILFFKSCYPRCLFCRYFLLTFNFLMNFIITYDKTKG